MNTLPPVIYLLTSLHGDVLIVIRHKSRQLNFTLDVKINHIEFEDKLLIKTHENVKYFLSEDHQRNFLTNRGRNEH